MKRRSNHSEIYKIDGVGVSLERFRPAESEEEKDTLRGQHGFSADDFILLYTAEFIPRKNHRLLFEILPELKKRIPSLKVVLCGKGELLESYTEYAAEHGMDYVTFTGYTKEVDLYCRIADVLFTPSMQEGLPVSVIEAMASGLPVVASKIRGHADALSDLENGFLCAPGDRQSFVKVVVLLAKNPALRKEIGRRNIALAQKFSVNTAVQNMAQIYGRVM